VAYQTKGYNELVMLLTDVVVEDSDQACDHGVQFKYHLFFFRFWNWPPFYAHRFCPLSKTLIRARQSASKLDRS
jgi:hypothetical protein